MDADTKALQLKCAIENIKNMYHDNWEKEHFPYIKAFYEKVQQGVTVPVLTVCGRGTQEIRYSKYLAYYLDHTALHGIENKLLKGILETININIHKYNLSKYEVQSEKWIGRLKGKGKTFYNCVCDISITGDNFVILIEQKVLSPESTYSKSDHTQLERYNNAINSNPEFEGKSIIKIYMTPDGKNPKNTNDWIALSYSEVINQGIKLINDNHLSIITKTNLQSFLLDLILGPYEKTEEEIKEIIYLAKKLIKDGYDFNAAIEIGNLLRKNELIIKVIMGGVQ